MQPFTGIDASLYGEYLSAITEFLAMSSVSQFFQNPTNSFWKSLKNSAEVFGEFIPEKSEELFEILETLYLKRLKNSSKIFT